MSGFRFAKTNASYFFVTPLYVAEIVTWWEEKSDFFVMLTAALLPPAGIVIEGATEAWAGSSLERLMTAPEGGATPFSSRPSASNFVSTAGVIVRAVLSFRSRYAATMLTGVLVLTPDVLISKVAT